MVPLLTFLIRKQSVGRPGRAEGDRVTPHRPPLVTEVREGRGGLISADIPGLLQIEQIFRLI